MSLAGNVAALALLALLLAGGELLSASRLPRHPPAPAFETTTDPSSVLLVVVDGLRADTAFDAARMPELARLAARGARGTLALESLVPATLGAIVAMVEGRVAPPLAALRDFGATAAARGGVLERLDARGGRSFVAGTALWDDLYGRWIDGGLAVEGFPDEVADRQIEAAARDALAAGEHELVVVHLGNLDRIGHRHGGASAAYAAAASAVDAAIGRLLAAAGPAVRVLVTADHGTTAGGGHAGPERAAREVPLILAGPGLVPEALGTRAQSALSGLLDEALGTNTDAADVSPDAAVSETPHPSVQMPGSARHAAWAAATALATLVVLGTLAGPRPLARTAFVLSAAVWVSLTASVAFGLPTGAASAGVALALAALILWQPTAASAATAPVSGSPIGAYRSIALASLVGVAFAGLRLADASGPEGARAALGVATSVFALGAFVAALGGGLGGGLGVGTGGRRWSGSAARRGSRFDVTSVRPPSARPTGALGAFGALAALAAWLGGPALALAAAFGALAGWRLRRARRATFVGIALAVLPAALARLAGETVSLSSVDVATAHRLLDGPVGLTGAVAVAVLREALPALALVAGWIARGREPACDGTCPTLVPSAFAATHVGAGLVFFAAFVGGDASVGVAVALGLGGLLHTLADICWVALGIGLGALVSDFAVHRPSRPATLSESS